MKTKQIVTRAAGVIVVVGALFGAGTVTQANEQSGHSGSKAQARAIEGVWLPIVTITDCQTQAVITTFPSMDIYVRGGGFLGFGAVRQSDQIGMGAWRHVGGRNVHGPVPVLRLHPVWRAGGHARRDDAQGFGNDPAQCRGYCLRRLSDRRKWSTPQAMCSRKSAEREQRRGCNSRLRASTWSSERRHAQAVSPQF